VRQCVPAGAEGSHASVCELRAELVVGAEVLVDEGGELAGGLSAAIGLHAVPVELVVEALSGVVEEGLVLACMNELVVRGDAVHGKILRKARKSNLIFTSQIKLNTTQPIAHSIQTAKSSLTVSLSKNRDNIVLLHLSASNHLNGRCHISFMITRKTKIEIKDYSNSEIEVLWTHLAWCLPWWICLQFQKVFLCIRYYPTPRYHFFSITYSVCSPM
jgi:hypothetical protein